MAYGARNYAGRSYADGAGNALAGTPGAVGQGAYWQTDVNGGFAFTASQAALWQTDLFAYLVPSKNGYFQVDENFGFAVTNTGVGHFQVDENFGVYVIPEARVGYFQVDEFFMLEAGGGSGTYGGFRYGALAYAQFLIRSADETLTTSDDAVRALFFNRTNSDPAPATDTVESSAIFPRLASDSLSTVLDAALRTLFMERTGVDLAEADDAADRLIYFARLSTDSAGATDIVVRALLLPRGAADSASAIDLALRQVFLLRDSLDSIPVADAAERIISLYRRTADDIALASDDVATRSVYFIRLAEDADVSSDVAIRQVVYFRGLADVASALGVVTSYTVQFRVAGVTIPTPTDVATQFVTFGAPEPTISFMSGSKVGVISPADTVMLQFTFDKMVFAWEVRANSTGPHDGDRVAGWQSEPGLETVDHGEAEITAEDLRHGANEIVVYGFTHSGGWSLHPLA